MTKLKTYDRDYNPVADGSEAGAFKFAPDDVRLPKFQAAAKANAAVGKAPASAPDDDGTVERVKRPDK